ncbi:MAG: hypothetical protein HY816_05600 [Candidatus Wallbacteria bacterium]|nr:hypothetical protein [Candidatus Wallbacteria bacterium]
MSNPHRRFPAAWRLALSLPVALVASLAVAPGAELAVTAPNVAVDRTFQIDVTVRGAQDLYGAALDLSYDPTVVSVVDRDANPRNGIQPSVWEGAFLGAGGSRPTVLASALENDRQGRLVLGLVRKGPVLGVSFDESRVLLSVLMRARAEGTAQLRVEAVALRDSGNGAVPLTTPSVASLVVASTVVNTAPVARAGADRSARPGTLMLDGSLSGDAEGDRLTYAWTRVSGPTATIDRANASIASFDASSEGVYVMRLTVSDGTLSAADDVSITVAAAANTRPTAAVRTPGPGDLVGAVPISYVLFDAESDAASVTAEYSLDGGTNWSTARAAGGDGTSSLAAAAAGSPHLFLWNSLADAGARRVAGARFRIRPRDAGGEGSAGASGGFDVDNSAAPVLVSIRAPLAGSLFFEGQIIRFEGLATDGAGTALSGSSLAWSSSLSGQFGTGATPATTLTTGEHVIRFTAQDSQSRTGAATMALRVLRRPEAAGSLTVTGRVTLAGTGANAPDGTLVTFFNLMRRVSTGARLESGDGVFSAVLSRSDQIAAAPGDPVLISVHDSDRMLLTAQPASLVLTLADFLERIRVQNIAVEPRTTLDLEAGLNLVALPSDPGTTAAPFTSEHLLSRTGARFVVRTVSPDAAARGRFQVYLGAGLTEAFPISGDQGYLVHVPSAFRFTFTGRAWPQAALSRRLHAGVNMLAFARGVPAGFSLADLAVQAGSTVVSRYDRAPEETSAARRFRAYLPRLGVDPEPVENGKAYLVVAPGPRDIVLPAR